jgi:hypothetical protein
MSRLTPDTVPKRGEGAGPRHHQVGSPARALADHGVGLEWGPVSTGEGVEWRVEGALWWRWQAFAAYWHGGGGSEMTHGPVALPRDRGITGGCGTQSGVSDIEVLRHPLVQGRVEAAR